VRQLLRIGGREDEDEVRRRLLEGLQKCCERVARDVWYLVDDHDAVGAAGRGEAHLLAQRLDVGDAAVRSAVDLGSAERDSRGDLEAARALVAGVRARLLPGPALLAVERLGEDAGARRLADS